MPSPASLANLRPRSPWRRGESGDARGRLATYREVLRLARTNSPDAMRSLIQCMNDVDAPWPARINAANGLLDRAWGKVPHNFTLDGEGAAILRVEFVDAGDATTITIQRPTREATINGEAHEDDDTLKLDFEGE
jgi:hypothetical protein